MSLFAIQERLPFATPDLPGSGGRVKDAPEDFVVEEIPAYQPSGEGEHLFIWLEKRDLDAQGLLRVVGARLEVPEGEIGCAGFKDARAVTRQMISVPARFEARLQALEAPLERGSLRVLWAKRHGNKLKTGHLYGNRFRIVLREPAADALPRAQAIAARLLAVGMPNYFGPQRFGRDGATLALGLRLLSGQQKPRRGRMLRLSLSAVQAALFNEYLAERLSRGDWLTVRAGDLMLVAASGGPFWADDVPREQARAQTGEIVTSGPMFGPKMRGPRGVGADEEAALLARHGMSLEAFSPFSSLVAGTRRALVVRPKELSVSSLDDGALVVETVLPKGVYATVLLREITKEGLWLDEDDD